MRELAKQRKEQEKDGITIIEPGLSPRQAPAIPPAAGPPGSDHPPPRDYPPPERVDVSDRGIPYHEDRLHGAPPFDPEYVCTKKHIVLLVLKIVCMSLYFSQVYLFYNLCFAVKMARKSGGFSGFYAENCVFQLYIITVGDEYNRFVKILFISLDYIYKSGTMFERSSLEGHCCNFFGVFHRHKMAKLDVFTVFCQDFRLE